MKGLTTPVFLLLALLVIVAYNVGFSRSVGAAGGAATGLTYALTGRNATGAFAGYPM